MQNGILEQAKVAEKGADYMFDGAALKKDKFHLQENFWLDGTESACIHYPQPLKK